MATATTPDFPPIFARLQGQFTALRELGRGGMGIVYLVRDEKLERPVAIKVLPSELAQSGDIRERFLREARIAAQLSHPNIVPVYRADEIDGEAFFVMAYVDGQSLADRVQNRGTLAPSDVAQTLREVAWALAYAHARGVVHRDVKPENILIEQGTGRALVSDFGIARDIRASRLTTDGTVLGSVHYMSPEQVSDDVLDGRSDLYSLGVVGFFALTGKLPFDDTSNSAILVAHVTKPAPRVTSIDPNIPESIASVIARCLEKDPADRYATGEALADALTKALSSDSSTLDDEQSSVMVSEAQAAALWTRAAQLQSEALQRIEAGVAKTGVLSDEHAMVAARNADGYRLRHVQDAAVEAGISRQFVALALAEMSPGQQLPAVRVVNTGDRLATALLGTSQRSLSVSKVIAASPARVLQALGAVLQREPFSLMLRETIGGHPLDGGVLVFDLPGSMMMGVTVSPTAKWVGTRQQLEAKQVQVTVKARGGDQGGTEVSMFVDLRPGVKANATVSGVISGMVGAAGAFISGGVAIQAAGAFGLATVGAPALLTGLVAAGLGSVWYRWLYPATLKKSAKEMRDALDAVDGSLVAQEVFGQPRI